MLVAGVWNQVTAGGDTDADYPEHKGADESARQESEHKDVAHGHYEDVDGREEAPDWPDGQNQECWQEKAYDGHHWDEGWDVLNIVTKALHWSNCGHIQKKR